MPLRNLTFGLLALGVGCTCLEQPRSAPADKPPVTPAATSASAVPATGDSEHNARIEAVVQRSPRLHITTVGLRQVSLRAVPVDFGRLKESYLDSCPAPASGQEFKLQVPVPEGAGGVDVDMSPALSNGHGLLAVQLTEQESSYCTLVAFTDLATTLREGPGGGAVWVTRLSNGRPVPDAQVQVTHCDRKLASGRTDEHGLLVYEHPPFAAIANCFTNAVVTLGDERGLALANFAGVHPTETASYDERAPAGDENVAIFADRGWYRMGDRVRFFGVARKVSGMRSAAWSGPLRIRVHLGSDQTSYVIEVPVSANGMFDGELTLPTELSGESIFGAVSLMALGKNGETISYRVAEYDEVPVMALTRARGKARFDPLPNWGPATPQPESKVGSALEWSLPYLEVGSDAEEYEPGQHVKLRLGLPFDQALALVTVERERVLKSFVLPVTAKQPTIELPVEAGWGPSPTLSVTVAAPEGTRPEGSFAVGNRNVQVGTAQYYLPVSARLIPTKSGTRVELVVTDRAGKPVQAELVVSALDERVARTHEAVPGEVFTRIYARKPLFSVRQAGLAYERPCDPSDVGIVVPQDGETGPSAADSLLGFARLTSDENGRARLDLPAPRKGVRYELNVLAASASGGVGAFTRTFVGK